MRTHRHSYEDPNDDTEEELSDIPSDFDEPDGTKNLRTRVVDRWHRYCRMKAFQESAGSIWQHPERALQAASANCLYRFLNWTTKLDRGKNGRKLRRYRKANAFKSDWKYFRGYYQKVKGQKMDRGMAKRLRTGIRSIIKKNRYDTQPRPNEPMYIEDMVPFNETILTTRKKRFYLGIQRIMLCLALMLGLFTASRKQAILRLQYKHLRVTLQKDPHGGPPVISIDIRPEYIKQLLGVKDLNEFSFPEIIYGVSLVFSPHVFILGLLFHADAFAPNVKSMDELRSLFIRRSFQQLEIPLKNEMDEYYLFCDVKVIKGKPTIIRDQRMSDSTYYSAMRSISEIMGLLNSFFFHQFRYGTGEILDSTGWVSDAQRNLIMNHDNTQTFLDYYRPRRHVNMQEAVLGLTPDKEWQRALTSSSRFKDPERPRYLDADAKALVEQDPDLQTAIRERNKLEDEYEIYSNTDLLPMLQEAEREVTNARQRARYKQKKIMRQGYSRKRAIAEINEQLSGAIQPDDDDSSSIMDDGNDDLPPIQAKVIEAILAVPVEWTLEGEWQRRNRTVHTIIPYCDYEEGGPLRGRPKRKRPSNDVDEPAESRHYEEQEVKETSEGKHIKNPKYKQKQEEEVWVCFQCGKEYAQKSSLLRHFRPAHLNDRQCNSCNDGWEHLEQMHWQRHIEAVHHLRT
ncbi:putative C2H2 finger domain protein [Talaromyces proteolyticus]|uniref:C2H2 finger domain protein n=1 Tax=Talaromyces proteolyticus TaxID=1131652 RepID=A0AAD4KPL1_9EURO|nr:putative C2H2 finger domain protein [Talaromyces proteolyticus]KAH8696361.1 putative C2H2 finger domain protein [Talaromyces proteolyticus]